MKRTIARQSRVRCCRQELLTRFAFIIQAKYLKKYSCLLAIPALCGLIFCTPNRMVYCANPAFRLKDSGLLALCVPLKKIHIEYFDDTKLKPDSQFTDSFLLEAANGFLQYEAMRDFKMASLKPSQQEMIEKIEGSGFSVLMNHTGSLPEVSQRIRDLAARCSVDVVILPYSCSVHQRITQPKPWRNRNGPGYQRPISFSATTSVHIQVWGKNGELLFERIGASDTGKPLLYSMLKKEKPKEDIVQFAKKMYAPPVIKSLYTSIQRGMRFN